MDTKEGFVHSEDVRIHYRAAGQGPLMLLVHGFPDNGDSFRAQVSEMSKNYTVVCPTLRGFPPSDIPDEEEAYDLAKVVGDLVAIIMHFGANLQPGKAFLGGHDFGAAAVQMLALFKPDLVAGLILFNPPIIPRLHELIQFDEEQQKLSEYTIKFIEHRKGDDKPANDTTQFIRNPIRRLEIQEYLRAAPMHGMMALYRRNFPGPPYGQKTDVSYMQFQVPTLIIWGVEDEYFSPKFLDGLPRIFHADARLVTIPKAGHWPFQEEPEKVNREVFSWLTELGNAGSGAM